MAEAADVRAAVQAHVAAVNDRDAQAVAAGFAADGAYTGPDVEAVGQSELYALFRAAFADGAAVDLETVRMVVAGDTAACELLHRIHGAGGAVLETEVAAFFTVADGLITKMRVYRGHPD